MGDRDELKKKLREKIKGKREGNDQSNKQQHQLKKDPQTALMSMGIDDLSVLKNAKAIVKNPKQFLHDTISENINNQSQTNNIKDDEDNEEMPPEAL